MANEKRLIDANMLKANFPVLGSAKDLWHSGSVRMAIDNAPTVDAVEVVRCRECKHWKHLSHIGCTDFVKLCSLANYMIGENGYCSYGERKADELP